MKSEKKKILSGKECEVMNYLPYFKEPPIDVIAPANAERTKESTGI